MTPLRRSALLAAVVGLAACGPGEVETACDVPGPPEALAARPSPYDSLTLEVGGREAKLCYSRPRARGRAVFGALVPFDTLWRTGANEPTILHLPFPARIGGMAVEPGSYSLYTVPRREGWTLVVNASTSQWGLTHDAYGAEGNFFPNAYTEEVRAREVGRGPVATERIEPEDQLTARWAPAGPRRSDLYIDWETTRVVIPVELGPGDDVGEGGS